MDSELSDGSLESLGGIEYFCIYFSIVIRPLELYRLGESLIERDPRSTWDELRKEIHLLEWHTERAARILDSSTSRKRTKSTYLCDSICTILFSDICEHLISSLIREIHINIRHRDARRIQKSLKKESVGKWVDIRDS